MFCGLLLEYNELCDEMRIGMGFKNSFQMSQRAIETETVLHKEMHVCATRRTNILIFFQQSQGNRRWHTQVGVFKKIYLYIFYENSNTLINHLPADK